MPPDEAIVRLSGMSERYLIYDDQPIKHKMLVLHEAAGMSGEFAAYLIRTLLSEGCLRHGTVESTANGLKPVMIEREGPAGLITSTTEVHLHAENETRLLSVPIDDTRHQTKRVMAAIARNNSHAADLADWHELQYWLADGERRVEVPFAMTLADLIPPIAVRLRRDFGSLLGLVRAHALLHRATRSVDEHGAIVATVDDYAAVRELVEDLISDGIGAQVSQAVRETVDAVNTIINGGVNSGVNTTHATNAQLVELLKIDKAAVSRRVRAAIAGGFLRNDEDRRGKPSKLAPADPLPDDREILPSADKLRECCSVDVNSDPPHPHSTFDDASGDSEAGDDASPEDRERAERIFDSYGDKP